MNQATQKLMFSSETDDWATPQYLFDELNAKYGPFQVDVCASPTNAKCPAYWTESNNSLSFPWNQYACDAVTFDKQPRRLWMNPPYGRGIGAWVQKAYEESQLGCVVCCLLPARTCTKWFHDYCLKYGKVTFIKGRLKFGGAKNCAPFPSMVVVFGLKEAA